MSNINSRQANCNHKVIILLLFCSLFFQRECLNYIRVLQAVDDTRLYVCGTHAFQPQCDYLVG